MRARTWAVALVAVGLAADVPVANRAEADEPIAPQSFQELRTAIRPHKGEGEWARIPWLASLWEARQRAAAAGKPILLWEMDGNPLGCT
jgi:hypothetical protein